VYNPQSTLPRGLGVRSGTEKRAIGRIVGYCETLWCSSAPRRRTASLRRRKTKKNYRYTRQPEIHPSSLPACAFPLVGPFPPRGGLGMLGSSHAVRHIPSTIHFLPSSSTPAYHHLHTHTKPLSGTCAVRSGAARFSRSSAFFCLAEELNRSQALPLVSLLIGRVLFGRFLISTGPPGPTRELSVFLLAFDFGSLGWLRRLPTRGRLFFF
jgi:hypothetical protein